MIDLQVLAAIDKETMDVTKIGISDPSEPGSVTVGGDSILPSVPGATVSSEQNSVVLTLVKPITRENLSALNNFREFAIYHSETGTIDIEDEETYDGIILTPATSHVFPTLVKTFFIVTAYDTFDNQSVGTTEISSTPSTTILVNLVPNPFFEVDSDEDGEPDEWTKDAGWSQSTDSYYGTYSMKGQGAAKLLYSDKVNLPIASTSLIVSGMAKTSATDYTIAELASATPGSAPKAYCVSSGNIVAIQRTSGGDEVIELWDVSNPNNPSLAGTVSDAGNDRMWPFKLYGDYLICGQGDEFLYIYDVSDPATPVEVEEFELDASTGVLTALTVRDWIVYACCDDDTLGGWIEVIDISTPSAALSLDTIVAIPVKANFLDCDAANDELIVVSGEPEYYTLPTGFSDPDTGWANEAAAYDGNTGTAAYTTPEIPTESWSSFIEFTFPEILCGGVSGDICDSRVTAITDIDFWNGSAWVDVYQGVAGIYTVYPFTRMYATKARVRMYNTDVSIAWFGRIREFRVHIGSRLLAYDVSDPTDISLDGGVDQEGAKNIILQGDYAYLTCDMGTDVDKIIVVDISNPAAMVEEALLGGAGADDYTGHDAILISQGSLVNVGTGTDSGKFSVSYWEMSSPELPTIEAVGSGIVGDMDAAAAAGGYIFGPDVGNTKLRVVTPAIAADWSLKVRFYTDGDVLIETIVVYNGIDGIPFTGHQWTAFSQEIPQTDIPGGASQVDFLCYCDETSGYVYVDNLEAVFDTA